MPYPKCKIYSDRSHYIAIPHTERPYKPRRKVQEEEIVVEEKFASAPDPFVNEPPEAIFKVPAMSSLSFAVFE